MRQCNKHLPYYPLTLKGNVLCSEPLGALCLFGWVDSSACLSNKVIKMDVSVLASYFNK